jgi:dGTPase
MDWKMLLCKDRPRVSTSTGDYREQFERDFDRTIFSTPVKRLQDKAQVFPLEPHDAIRTRLTHSLEVSSVARGLAIAVGKWLLDEKFIEPGMERSIEAISATCGLIHDLGNPPSGIQERMLFVIGLSIDLAKASLAGPYMTKANLFRISSSLRATHSHFG